MNVAQILTTATQMQHVPTWKDLSNATATQDTQETAATVPALMSVRWVSIIVTQTQLAKTTMDHFLAIVTVHFLGMALLVRM